MENFSRRKDLKLSLKIISLAFTAGCLGGLCNATSVWGFGALGVTGALGVKIAPAFTAPFLYQKLVWGGLWGWLFLLPLTGLSFPARALLYSLGPSLVQLLVVFPYQAQKGVLGLQLGYLTPAFVLFYNAVWGIVTGWWLQLAEALDSHSPALARIHPAGGGYPIAFRGK